MRIYYPFTHSFLDYPSPEGSCISLYMTGCEHNCLGCSNPDFQNYYYMNDDIKSFSGENQISYLIDDIMYYSKKYRTNKICLMGGDPLFRKNIKETQYLINELKDTYDFCIYTGYSIDYVKQNKIIEGFKYIKCNTYKEELKVMSEKTDEYIQFASTNQELYDSELNLLSVDGRFYF